MVDEMLIQKVARKWNLGDISIHPEITLVGSPERSIFRIAIKSDDKYYILERIAPVTVPRKNHIAQILEFFSGKKISCVFPYLPSENGKYIERSDDTYWQITSLIEGVSLQRPAYIYDGWRGCVLADFLLDLREKSSDAPLFEPSFSIKAYVDDFLKKLKVHRPDVYGEIQPVIYFLAQDFMDNHEGMPVVFCHGDYHPLNIIWAEKSINAVIDWEFCGYKPEIYDIANMIGCIGVEDPEGLKAELVKNFIYALRKKDFISTTSWNFLFETIVAIRLAWLAVWLNNKDEEMVVLECEYMKILLEQKEQLKEIWGIAFQQ